MEVDWQTMEVDCQTMEVDWRTMEVDCQTMEVDCRTISIEDRRTQPDLNGALFIFSFFEKIKKAGVEGGIVAQIIIFTPMR